MKLLIVIGSIRAGRRTARLSKWVEHTARQIEGVEVELIDLKDYPMPFFVEPASPRYNSDRNPDPTAKKWLDKLDGADALVFVTPEYNHSIPGVLKNAIDYIDWQTAKKPATIVSHGTVGGARAIMHLKEIISEVQAIPMPNALSFLSKIDKVITDDGLLNDELKRMPYGPQASLEAVLDELLWYARALKSARDQAAL